MQAGGGQTLHYRRSHFATQLPIDFLYSPSHAWISRDQAICRVGLTKFASRMLGEMVDHGFEVESGATVVFGQIIGWVEGFKAISDLFCIAEGVFKESNPVLKGKIAIINKDCYGAGWLYAVKGQPDPKCMDVYAYRDLLDKTIDRLLAQRKGEEIQ